jgi:4-amino-4-deoxychorismate lyase
LASLRSRSAGTPSYDDAVPAVRLVAVLGVGVASDPDTPVVHADDLGMTRGDGCFEATRLVTRPDGTAHLDHLDAHVARLHRSATALDIPVDEPAWRELIDKAIAAWDTPGEAVLRVMLSRGRESTPGAPPTGVLTITPLDERTLRARDGINLATLSRGHTASAFAEAPWLLGGVKTLSYAINMAAGREGTRLGVDDVLFVSTDGFALEAPRSALVWREDDRLLTTPTQGTGVLASITQVAAFESAEAAGVPTASRLITIEELHRVDGAWLLSSGRLVAPVRALDGRSLPVDPEWTTRLRGFVAPFG